MLPSESLTFSSEVVPYQPFAIDNSGLSNKSIPIARYIEVPAETNSEELPLERLGIGSPRSLLGNSELSAGTINLPVPLNGGKDSPALSAGCRVPEGAEPQTAITRTQQNDPSSITCYKDRWGTPQDGGLRGGLYFDPKIFDYFVVPGVCEITDPEGCGAWKKTIACSKDILHYNKAFGYNCGHVCCPVCWNGPINKVSRTASNKLWGLIKAIRKAEPWDNHPELILNHFVLSSPPGLITPDMPYNKIKQKARDMAAKANITGGFMAFHPFRIKKYLKWRLVKQCKENPDTSKEEHEKKFWEIVKADALNLGSWKEYVYWSPHFHVIGFGKLPDQYTPEQKEEIKKLYKGWIVTWIRHVETYQSFTGQRIEDPIKDVIFYILSHAGYQEGKKMPVWLGNCSQNKLHAETTIKHSYPVICPKCGAPVVMGEELYGVFEPVRDSETGHAVQYCIKCRETIYVIGRGKKGAFKLECEQARLDRLRLGLT